MVEYYDCRPDAPDDEDVLGVDPLGTLVEFSMGTREENANGAARAGLGLSRDSVAALVGQLQSWLARTAEASQ